MVGFLVTTYLTVFLLFFAGAAGVIYPDMLIARPSKTVKYVGAFVIGALWPFIAIAAAYRVFIAEKRASKSVVGPVLKRNEKGEWKLKDIPGAEARFDIYADGRVEVKAEGWEELKE